MKLNYDQPFIVISSQKTGVVITWTNSLQMRTDQHRSKNPILSFTFCQGEGESEGP